MIALFVALLLDLTGGAPPDVNQRDGLALAMIVRGGAVLDGQQVAVVAELKNVGPRPLRIVWGPSGPQPLTLFVDGKAHPLPPPPSRAQFAGWVELAPGESRAATLDLVLGVGVHQLRWLYAVERGPYGKPLERCFAGRLATAATIVVPIIP